MKRPFEQHHHEFNRGPREVNPSAEFPEASAYVILTQILKLSSFSDVNASVTISVEPVVPLENQLFGGDVRVATQTTPEGEGLSDQVEQKSGVTPPRQRSIETEHYGDLIADSKKDILPPTLELSYLVIIAGLVPVDRDQNVIRLSSFGEAVFAALYMLHQYMVEKVGQSRTETLFAAVGLQQFFPRKK